MSVHPAFARATSPAWSEASADDSVGVDYLGTRAANLEMLTRLTGPYNNVAVSARQHAILCWAAWRYRENCRVAKSDPVPRQCRDFLDAIETIQLAGQRAKGASVGGSDRGLGANSSEQLGAGPTIPLRFKDYGRSHQTSALAAVQYGPSAKPRSIGLLDVQGGVWAPTKRGVDLALALDESLKLSTGYAKLLTPEAPAEFALLDAIDLASCGLIIGTAIPSRPERGAYVRALFNLDGHISHEHERPLSFALVATLVDLIGDGEDVTRDQIRRAMLSGRSESEFLNVPSHLTATARRWQIFQLRQLQRFALEAWLFLAEWDMLAQPHTGRELIADYQLVVGGCGAPYEDLPKLLIRPVGEVVSAYLEHRDVTDLMEWVASDEVGTPWALTVEIAEALVERSRARAVPAIMSLTIAVLALTEAITTGDAAFAAIGERRRISLVHFKHWWGRRRTRSLAHAFEAMLEELVLQQHVAVAVSRFDNEQRRLRFSNDEAGWEALPGTVPSEPTLTPDRIVAMLSLMSDLALAVHSDEGFTITDAGREVLVQLGKTTVEGSESPRASP